MERSTGSFLSQRPLAAIALLTPLVLVVHGYHPLADDGGVYVTGIKKLADRGLYQTDAVFALSPTHLSIFAHVLAVVVRTGHVSIPALLLICHMVSIFLFLLGSWKVATQVSTTPAAQWGAVLLAACCFTLPVAGTSLVIMDPYVTARSFSTPLALLALAAALREKWRLCLFWLVFTGLLHPLMAGYAAIFVLMLAAAKHRTRWLLVMLVAAGWSVCAVIFLLTQNADPTLDYNRAPLSRSYFFLSSWQWYEYLGLGMPVLLLGIAGMRSKTMPARALAAAATAVGACALLASVCFVHRSGSLLLARLQILRAFHMVYLAGVLLAGGLLGKVMQKHKLAAVSLYAVCAGALFLGQWLTYAESSHVEWPGLAARNPWEQAFVWIRTETPHDAIFALDNDYIESPGEDAQGFRAIAERSAVADWYKDGGIASNFRAAAALWWQGSQATYKLDEAPDAERLARLLPLGATWIVLPARAATGFPCPYRNSRVLVCMLKP